MWRLANAFMAALFVLSALLQYNDPDPIRWAAIYLGAAILSGWPAFRPAVDVNAGPPPRWPLSLALVALLWSLAIVGGAWGRTRFDTMFATMGMVDLAAEIGRECMGLLLVAAWMTVVGLEISWRRRSAERSNRR